MSGINNFFPSTLQTCHAGLNNITIEGTEIHTLFIASKPFLSPLYDLKIANQEFYTIVGCTNFTTRGSWGCVPPPITIGDAIFVICQNISFFEAVNSNDSISIDRTTSAVKKKKIKQSNVNRIFHQ